MLSCYSIRRDEETILGFKEREFLTKKVRILEETGNRLDEYMFCEMKTIRVIVYIRRPVSRTQIEKHIGIK